MPGNSILYHFLVLSVEPDDCSQFQEVADSFGIRNGTGDLFSEGVQFIRILEGKQQAGSQMMIEDTSPAVGIFKEMEDGDQHFRVMQRIAQTGQSRVTGKVVRVQMAVVFQVLVRKTAVGRRQLVVIAKGEAAKGQAIFFTHSGIKG